jgi:glutathione-dependent peroxiredoxin
MITIWTRNGDPFCVNAIKQLQRARKEYIEKRLGENATVDQLEAAAPGVKELPAVFIDDQYVGGLRALQSYLRNP